METYLNEFLRAAREEKGYGGMPAWEVKIIAEDIIKERDTLKLQVAELRQRLSSAGVEGTCIHCSEWDEKNKFCKSGHPWNPFGQSCMQEEHKEGSRFYDDSGKPILFNKKDT